MAKKRSPVNSKKNVVDGTTFKSGLERYTYIALKESGLFEIYKVETI